jgi:hypothetical protein
MIRDKIWKSDSESWGKAGKKILSLPCGFCQGPARIGGKLLPVNNLKSKTGENKEKKRCSRPCGAETVSFVSR